MGYVPQTIKKVYSYLLEITEPVVLLELGNQYIFPNGEKDIFGFRLSGDPTSNTSRDFWRYKQFDNHTYMDYNGKDGSIPVDLGVIYNTPNKYNVITNLGTLEHVGESYPKEDILLAQYNAFKNIHEFGTDHCLYFHLSPKVGSWPDHCPCYYTEEFFHSLAKSNKYKLIEGPVEYNYSIPQEMFVLTVYNKSKDNEFMSFESFSKLKGLEIV